MCVRFKVVFTEIGTESTPPSLELAGTETRLLCCDWMAQIPASFTITHRDKDSTSFTLTGRHRDSASFTLTDRERDHTSFTLTGRHSDTHPPPLLWLTGTETLCPSLWLTGIKAPPLLLWRAVTETCLLCCDWHQSLVQLSKLCVILHIVLYLFTYACSFLVGICLLLIFYISYPWSKIMKVILKLGHNIEILKKTMLCT